MKYFLFILMTVLMGCGSAPAAVLVFSDNGAYSSAFTNLSTAKTAPNVKRVVVTTPQTLTNNITWPTDRELKFEKGGYIVQNAYKLTGLRYAEPEHFDAKRDGTTDDAVAMLAAFNAVASGGELHFNKGTYLTTAVNVSAAMSNLRITGDGAVIKRKPTGASPDTSKIWNFTGGWTNVEMSGLTFDVNGCERYGGVNVYSGVNVPIYHNKFIDSNYVGNTGYDHYGLVFGENPVGPIKVTENYFEYASFSTTGTVDGVTAHDNTFKDCRTYAIGINDGHSGKTIRNVNIYKNASTSTDPTSDGGGIWVGADTGGGDQSNTTIENISIEGNTLHNGGKRASIRIVSALSGLAGENTTPAVNYASHISRNWLVKGNNIIVSGTMGDTVNASDAAIECRAPKVSTIASAPQDTGIQIVNNNVTRTGGNFGRGIHVDGAGETSVKGNYVKGFPVGIRDSNASGQHIFDNEILGSTTAAITFRDSFGGSLVDRNKYTVTSGVKILVSAPHATDVLDSGPFFKLQAFAGGSVNTMTSTAQNVTITGIKDGDVCTAIYDRVIPDTFGIFCKVVASNTAQVRFFNFAGTSQTIPAGNINIEYRFLHASNHD